MTYNNQKDPRSLKRRALHTYHNIRKDDAILAQEDDYLAKLEAQADLACWLQQLTDRQTSLKVLHRF